MKGMMSEGRTQVKEGRKEGRRRRAEQQQATGRGTAVASLSQCSPDSRGGWWCDRDAEGWEGRYPG